MKDETEDPHWVDPCTAGQTGTPGSWNDTCETVGSEESSRETAGENESRLWRISLSHSAMLTFLPRERPWIRWKIVFIQNPLPSEDSPSLSQFLGHCKIWLQAAAVHCATWPQSSEIQDADSKELSEVERSPLFGIWDTKTQRNFKIFFIYHSRNGRGITSQRSPSLLVAVKTWTQDFWH